MALTKATQNVLEGIVSTGSTGVSAGSFIVAQQYKITALGTTTNTQWNTIAGTTGQTYVVGSLFTAATTGASSGTGAAAVARTLANRFNDVLNLKDFGTIKEAITAAVAQTKIIRVDDSITVNIPTDALTLQIAIDTLLAANEKCVITLKIDAGHQPTSGITVSNGNYSQFRITSTDAEVTLSLSFGTGANFIYGQNARLPRLACLINANLQANNGYAAIGASVGYVEENCGVKNTWGNGCQAHSGSTIYADKTIWTGCAKNNATGSGIIAWGSIVYASEANASNSMYYGAQAAHGGILVIDNGTANNCFRYNLRATDAGFMSADGVTANYAGCVPITNIPYPDASAAGYGIYAFNGSWIAARDASATNAKNTGVLASNGCTIHVKGATLTNCGVNGVYANPCSTVDATTTNVSGAGTHGYYAAGGSTINARSSTANNCGTGINDAAAYAEEASRINVDTLTATGCSGIVIRCESASTINCANSTITGAGNKSVYAAQASIVNATNCTGTGAISQGVFAASGSTINAQSSNFQRSVATTSILDIVVENGAFINAAGAIGGVSQTINVLTAEGVIFR